MSATTPTMYLLQCYYGTKSDVVRERFVALPLITALTEPEPGEPRRYYVLPPDVAPEPVVEEPRGHKEHARRYRDLGAPLE